MSLSIVTWNTQGNPKNAPPKLIQLDQLVANNDVVLLQECGDFVNNHGYNNKYVYGSEQAGAFNIRCSTAIIASGQVQAQGLWSGSETGRAGMWIRLPDIGGFANVVIATIHAKSGGVGMSDLRPFLGHLVQEVGENTPLIVGGDFNCSPDPVHNALINMGTDSRPVFFEFHTQGIIPTHSSGAFLDHFLCRNAVVEAGPECTPVRPSDHNPVSARFRLAS